MPSVDGGPRSDFSFVFPLFCMPWLPDDSPATSNTFTHTNARKSYAHLRFLLQDSLTALSAALQGRNRIPSVVAAVYSSSFIDSVSSRRP